MTKKTDINDILNDIPDITKEEIDYRDERGNPISLDDIQEHVDEHGEKTFSFDLEKKRKEQSLKQQKDVPFSKDLDKKNYDFFTKQPEPWLDVRLGKNIMKNLWDNINTSTQSEEENAKPRLAGQISRSFFMEDKKDWFYKTVLEECCKFYYYKDSWHNYYTHLIAKSTPPPVFELETFWVNYQKQHEFNPPHYHNGVYSFVVFMRIPTHWKDQHALELSANTGVPCASDFQFWLPESNTPSALELGNFPLCSEDEGRMLFFPAWLMHQVFPFYGTEDERITVSGNIVIRDPGPTNNFDMEMEDESVEQSDWIQTTTEP